MDKIKLFFLNNKKYIIIIGSIVLIILLIVYLSLNDSNGGDVLFNEEENNIVKLSNNDELNDLETKSNEENKLQEEYIYVDIKGYINKPNVYKIDKSLDYRVSDIITLAGGLKKDADTSVINLSMKLYDEMVIKIYSKTEVKNYLKTLETDAKENTICKNDTVKSDACICDNNEINIKDNDNNSNNIVNINTASKEDLMSLPGIGESKAISIIEYRNNTKFSSIEDIKNVSGIAESVYEKIKDFIKV